MFFFHTLSTSEYTFFALYGKHTQTFAKIIILLIFATNTRIKSIQKQQLITPNSKLTNYHVYQNCYQSRHLLSLR